MKTAPTTLLDISLLSEQARQEVTDFYQFLARKYAVAKRRNATPDPVEIMSFFQQYQVDMSSYCFNRDEAHER